MSLSLFLGYNLFKTKLGPWFESNNIAYKPIWDKAIYIKFLYYIAAKLENVGQFLQISILSHLRHHEL